MGERVDTGEIPVRCDGCGRDAVRTEMARHGWTVRPVTAGFAGRYCLSCATVLRTIDLLVSCSECGRAVDDDTAEERGWTYWWSDRFGELNPYCPECAQRQFGQRS